MKAFVVRRYGPDGLGPAELPDPRPGRHDVLVDVRAASINPLDRLVRDGEFKQLLPYRRPFVLGHDLAGVVTEVGADVRGFAVGDEVWSRPRDLRIGAFAEAVAVDADDVALKPASLSFAEAAAVPLVALAAWQALVEVARVRPGQKVLVHAGAGGLGSTVIQVAHHLGAHVATTARAGDADRLRALGADEVVDYTTTDVADVLSSYDVVVDSLGTASLRASMAVLAQGGLVLSVVGPPDPAFATQLGRPLLKPVMALLSRSVRREARRRGVRYAFFFMRADGDRLAALARLYDDGTLRPVLDRTFPFEETLEAMAYVEGGRAKGKIVITR
ncbi:NADP-dependent oxidoreductase [Nocardioides marinquilinus]|uniref:NADP-dependent oxidoreductase n=1 Tax=Nocardioides marinquilinus TaxID=1210400 RepID=A0ABP9Q3Y7_9ACTN